MATTKCGTIFAAALTVPIVAPVLWVAAIVGIHMTRRGLHSLLRHLHQELGVDQGVVNEIEGYGQIWISFFSIVDTAVLVATVLSAGLVRDKLRSVLARGCCGRLILTAQGAIFFVLFIIVYAGMYAAIAFALACAVTGLVTFAVHEACVATGQAAEYSTAFIAQQIDTYTSVKVRFCTVGIDDTLQQFYYQADDDTAFADDDDCLENLDEFCQPYIHGIYRSSQRLLIGAALVALVQINFSLLVLERYRVIVPLVADLHNNNDNIPTAVVHGETSTISPLADPLLTNTPAQESQDNA